MIKITGAIILGAALAVFVMLAIGYDRQLAASFTQNTDTITTVWGMIADTTAAMYQTGGN